MFSHSCSSSIFHRLSSSSVSDFLLDGRRPTKFFVMFNKARAFGDRKPPRRPSSLRQTVIPTSSVLIYIRHLYVDYFTIKTYTWNLNLSLTSGARELFQKSPNFLFAIPDLILISYFCKSFFMQLHANLLDLRTFPFLLFSNSFPTCWRLKTYCGVTAA